MARTRPAPTKAELDLGFVREPPPTNSKGKDLDSGKMPPENMYHRSPVFGEDDDFWQVVQDFSENSEPVENPIITGEEPTEARVEFIEEDSILRLHIERGDFPWCFVQLMGPSGGAADWEKWTDFILSNPDYVETLKLAGIHDTVRAFRHLRLNKNLDHINLILSRWSTSTHTIVTGWGEVTLLHLSYGVLAWELEALATISELWYVEEYDVLALALNGRMKVRKFQLGCSKT